jgi:hypothetical protein
MLYTSCWLGTMSRKYFGSFCATACTPHTTLAFLAGRSVVGLGSKEVNNRLIWQNDVVLNHCCGLQYFVLSVGIQIYI